MTLGLAKLRVDTIGRTLAMNKAKSLLDAVAVKLTQLTQPLTDFWELWSRHTVTHR